MRELNVDQQTIDSTAASFCKTEQLVEQEKANKQKAHSKYSKPGPTEGLDQGTLKMHTKNAST